MTNDEVSYSLAQLGASQFRGTNAGMYALCGCCGVIGGQHAAAFKVQTFQGYSGGGEQSFLHYICVTSKDLVLPKHAVGRATFLVKDLVAEPAFISWIDEDMMNKRIAENVKPLETVDILL